MARKTIVSIEAPAEEVERFIRLKNVTKPTDSQPAFQPEVIEIVGDRVVKRTMVDKPDIAPIAYSKAMMLVDPDGER